MRTATCVWGVCWCVALSAAVTGVGRQHVHTVCCLVLRVVAMIAILIVTAYDLRSKPTVGSQLTARCQRFWGCSVAANAVYLLGL
jgi:hypothetical protein